MGKSFSAPSDKFKENYEKIFGKKKNPSFDELPVPIRINPYKGLSDEVWKRLRETYNPFRLYSPYMPCYSVEKFSDELDDKMNHRIVTLIKKAREGGLVFDPDKYHLIYNVSGNDPELSLPQLGLRGLFTSPQFIKAFFQPNMLGQPFNIARFHADLFQAETIEDMVNYLEGFLYETGGVEEKFIIDDPLLLPKEEINWKWLDPHNEEDEDDE